jgi:hypothetical protein
MSHWKGRIVSASNRGGAVIEERSQGDGMCRNLGSIREELYYGNRYERRRAAKVLQRVMKEMVKKGRRCE